MFIQQIDLFFIQNKFKLQNKMQFCWRFSQITLIEAHVAFIIFLTVSIPFKQFTFFLPKLEIYLEMCKNFITSITSWDDNDCI